MYKRQVEACGDRIESLMTYTGKRKQVATVTDSRGYTTTNTYDADDRLLTQVKDANGSVTNYTYENNTDRLASVSKTVGGKEVKVDVYKRQVHMRRRSGNFLKIHRFCI